MRISHALSLGVILALPLGAQQAESGLYARLVDGGSFVSFHTNAPAYVAVFDLTRNTISQVYPFFTAQPPVTAGNLTFSYASAYRDASFGRSDALNNHRYVLIASNEPLRLNTPWTTPELVGRSLERAGYSGLLDTQQSIDALVEFVGPADKDADVVVDELVRSTGSPQQLVVSGVNCSYVSNYLVTQSAAQNATGEDLSLVNVCGAPRTTDMWGIARHTDTTSTVGGDSSSKSVGRAAVQRKVGAHGRLAEPGRITDPQQIKSFMSSVTGTPSSRWTEPAHSPRISASGANTGSGTGSGEGAGMRSGARVSAPAVAPPTPTARTAGSSAPAIKP